MTVELERKVIPEGEIPLKNSNERRFTDSICSRLMINYREGGRVIRIADDRVPPFEGIGNLPMSSRSDRWLGCMPCLPLSLLVFSFNVKTYSNVSQLFSC